VWGEDPGSDGREGYAISIGINNVLNDVPNNNKTILNIFYILNKSTYLRVVYAMKIGYKSNIGMM
jgi:hypothetical protein